MTAQTVLETAIPGGASVSPGVRFAIPGLTAIITSGVWADAVVSFLVSDDGGATWQNFYDAQGNEYTKPIAAGEFVALDADLFLGVSAIKIRSGTSAVPVVQPVDATLELIGYFTVDPAPVVVPNLRRTLFAEGPGYIGQWPAMVTTESDTLTADLTDAIDANETIVIIDTFALTPVGPNGTTDPTPADRALGVATVSGAQVSQFFGNWLAVPAIMYRVDVGVTTSRGDHPQFYGYLAVNQAN